MQWMECSNATVPSGRKTESFQIENTGGIGYCFKAINLMTKWQTKKILYEQLDESSVRW